MNYKTKFKNGKLPKPADLRGAFTVKLAPPVFPPFQLAGHQKIFPKGIVREGGGFNLFFDRWRLGNFRLEVGPSELGDHLKVLKIIYDHPSNPPFLKLLTDEIREVKRGHYLGRGIVNIFGIKFIIFYFTVTSNSPNLG